MGPVNNSVVKAFAILDIFNSHREEITTLDVVNLLGFNAITAHRFLKTLVQVGALISSRKGVYRLGYKLVDYGTLANNTSRLAFQLQPFLNILAEDTNEGVMATVFDGTSVVCIATAYSDRAFIINARVGATHEPYATANGKLWLAYIDRDRLDAYLTSHELVAFAENTLTDKSQLLQELTKVRDVGYATNYSEREVGLYAIAAPVLSKTNEIIAGVSVFAPAERMDKKIEAIHLKKLLRTVRKIHSTLYGSE